MGRDATEMERVVARTLRDSLEKLQRTADEVNQAVGDLVSACASARPGNSLPHVLRAQTAAASLAASLDVLSRFITFTLQPDFRAPLIQPDPAPEAELKSPVEVAESPVAIPVAYESAPVAVPAASIVEEALPMVASEALEMEAVPDPTALELPIVSIEEHDISLETEPRQAARVFDVATLPAEEQELHRRANRVAKVSMQDIKLLRPSDVQLGKENNDICSRLRDDIERAHKEYERRFQSILDHPVDYFYAWMVEILGEGDPNALGQYPYPSPVAHR